jgi:hypothetical protein
MASLGLMGDLLGEVLVFACSGLYKIARFRSKHKTKQAVASRPKCLVGDYESAARALRISDAISGDAVVTKGLPNRCPRCQIEAKPNWPHAPMAIGFLRILPNLSKPCKMTLGPLSRR